MSPRVRLLGHPRVEDGTGPPGRPPRGQKSWALLARVALAERPLTRSELAGELFGEADDPLGALRWCLADLRRCLGDPRLLRGDPVTLTDGTLWLDVWALWDGSLLPADIGGELLAGVEPRHCPAAFGMWLMLARGRCAARSMEELHQAALRLLAAGDAAAAADLAGRAVALDPMNEGAQELFLRALVATGHPARAAVHLAACEAVFAREGIPASPALRAAALAPSATPRAGLRAGVVSRSLLRAGTAALDAGSADAGIETLRRAAEEAERAGDPLLSADVQRTLGSALVHSVRGFDGEGAVVLHRALAAARTAGSQSLTADILRELAFTDLQAGRHASAARALDKASAAAAAEGDPALGARVLAIRGMNEADQGHHDTAVRLLTESAQAAASAGSRRQEAWSTGVMARSLLLAGQAGEARAAAERSIALCEQDRWNAFLPWPQALRAHCLVAAGQWGQARDDAEQAFALACQLGDPCWEGMAGRSLALLAMHGGDRAGAQEWILDARRRCDRVPDRYVWVSAFVALGQLEIAARQQPDLVMPLARGLYQLALRCDLPEFIAWALIYQAEAGEPAGLPLARAIAGQVTNPELRARAGAV
ncbi:MAG TPA: BTAD domain-containing putative transcriptional regulator, partial [Streptosporangiaceae bacterium]|nr:BTAD domain-containing putative transcriptional regulator [Streptosporangiaceae bacterium]